MRRRSWKLRGLAAAALTATLGMTAACGGGSNSSSGTESGELNGKVYFILPDAVTVRFEKFDKPAFVAAMKERAPDMEVEVLNSENNVQRQTSQVQTAITNGAKAIVLVSVDPEQAAGVLAQAAAADVPVICHSHACDGGSAYAYLVAPFVEIGETQGKAAADAMHAQFEQTGQPVRLAKIYGDPKFPFYTDQVTGFSKFIDPLVTAGEIDVVCQADALLWDPTKAQQAMDQCLTSTQNGVDAVLTMNDDLGGGALASLQSAGVNEVKLYGGYDASLAGVQRVAAGIQALDMSVQYDTMNDLAAQLVVAAVQGEEVPTDLQAGTYDNGTADGLIQVNAPNDTISADNLDETVVQKGLYTKDQICSSGLATTSPFCTA